VAQRPPASRAAAELGHARYYLRRNCQPCAQRHFDLAREHGATEAEIEAVLAAL
jgi:Carboxymuconolactone decarboxylase family